jgi:hypothetical protein
MPKTIKLPAIGTVRQEYVIVVGGGVAVIVGYKYWKARNAPADDTFGTGVEPGPGLIENTPGYMSSGPAGLYGSPDSGERTPGPGDFRNNSEWFQYAVDYLASRLGVAETAGGPALSKYLDRKQLTSTEISYVQQAVAAAGQPPVGGPYSVLPVSGTTNPPTATTPPGRVTNLSVSASRTQIMAKWNHPTSGARAIRFRVEFYGGRPGGGTFVVSGYTTTSTTQKSAGNLKPNHDYGVRVAAIGTDGQIGPWESRTIKTDR